MTGVNGLYSLIGSSCSFDLSFDLTRVVLLRMRSIAARCYAAVRLRSRPGRKNIANHPESLNPSKARSEDGGGGDEHGHAEHRRAAVDHLSLGGEDVAEAGALVRLHGGLLERVGEVALGRAGGHEGRAGDAGDGEEDEERVLGDELEDVAVEGVLDGEDEADLLLNREGVEGGRVSGTCRRVIVIVTGAASSF